MKRVGQFIICSVLFSMVACTDTPEIPASPVVSFKTDVGPIIQRNCATTAGCHTGSNGQEHLHALLTYSDVMYYADASGKDAMKSKLMQAITQLNWEEAMPPGNPLPNENLKTIYIWLLQGAKDN